MCVCVLKPSFFEEDETQTHAVLDQQHMFKSVPMFVLNRTERESSSQCRMLLAESSFLPRLYLLVRCWFLLQNTGLYLFCYYWDTDTGNYNSVAVQMPSTSHCSHNLLRYVWHDIWNLMQKWTHCNYSRL